MAKVDLYDGVIDRIAAHRAEAGLRAALGKAERILKDDVLIRPGTGKTYRRGGKEHQASSPGQPPALDAGDLRTNTNADPEIKTEGVAATGRVVANSAKAEALERGTERMAARPFLSLLGTQYASDLRRAFVEGAKETG